MEYLALNEALEYLLQFQLQENNVHVFGDSNLVINQLNGTYEIGNGFYKNEALRCQWLAKEFKQISFTWIPREQNFEADELSNLYYKTVKA